MLSAVDGSGHATGYRDQVNFGPAAENVSIGRGATAQGSEFWAQTARASGAANAAPVVQPVSINEVMYHPPDLAGGDNSRDEFLELYNPTNFAVDLSGWRLKGDSDFTFASGTTLAAGGYAQLVGLDPANAAILAGFRAVHGLTAAAGSATFTVQVPDGEATVVEKELTLTVASVALTIIDTASPLPDAVWATGYTQAFSASGGTSPYVWSLASGSLPSGLSLSSGGYLAGTLNVFGSHVSGVVF